MRKNKKNSKKIKNKKSCKNQYKKLLSILQKKGKLHVKYGSKKIKLNIGCPELKRKKMKILPPSIYNI